MKPLYLNSLDRGRLRGQELFEDDLTSVLLEPEGLNPTLTEGIDAPDVV